jgi:hypothetical protein
MAQFDDLDKPRLIIARRVLVPNQRGACPCRSDTEIRRSQEHAPADLFIYEPRVIRWIIGKVWGFRFSHGRALTLKVKFANY